MPVSRATPYAGFRTPPLAHIKMPAQGKKPSPCPECELWTNEGRRACDHGIILKPRDASGLRSLELDQAVKH